MGIFVPLAGGAMAPGVVNPEGEKKMLQHLEGGIIAELRVRDGDHVDAGQPLLVLESVLERANHDALQEQFWTLLSKQVRLEAERTHQDPITWPPTLPSANAQVRAILEAQQQVFDTRRTTLATKKSVLRQKIAQLLEQIKGFEAQVLSTTQQLSLIGEEMRAKDLLVERAWSPSPKRCV